MHETPPRFRHPSVRPGRRQRRSIYAVSLLLVTSGLVWLLAHYLLPLPEDAARHPLEPWALRVHGASAMLGLAVFGALWANHVMPAWRRREHFASGLPLLASWLLLILSAWGLYYLADESWRAWTSTLHLVLGGVLPLALAAHVLGRKGRHPRPDKAHRQEPV